MQNMTQATADLLKSRSMIGPNKPAQRVRIAEQDEKQQANLGRIRDFMRTGEGTIIRPTLGISCTSSHTMSNIVPTADGRFMAAWINADRQLIVGYMLDESFFDTSYTMTDSITYATVAHIGGSETVVPVSKIDVGTSMYRRDDGKVLLFISDPGKPATDDTRVFTLISQTGNGDDFEHFGTILELPAVAREMSSSSYMNIPIQTELPDGSKRLVLAFISQYLNDSDYRAATNYIYTSDNNGATWTQRLQAGRGYGASLPFFLGQPAQIPSGEMYIELTYSSSYNYLFESVDGGNTWANAIPDKEYAASSAELGASLFWDAAGNCLYRHAAYGNGKLWRMTMPTPAAIKAKRYTLVYEGIAGAGNVGFGRCATISPMPSGNVAIQGRLVTSSLILGLGESVPAGELIDLQPKSISINRTKGAASGLTVTADNKGGQYSPDGQTGWNQILWPNAEIVVEQGYGTDLIQTYKGSLDSVEMSTFPQEIRLSARDAMKAALDQTVTGSTGNHVLIYTNSTVESIFISLCNFAGITYGTVETTGLTIARKEFAWESFSDAMQWLAELVGFEIVADEQSLLHFRRDWYPTDGTSVYTFTEGIDIISLGYTIDDRDLYNQVICHGRDADDNVIELVTNVPGADYWRLPSNKIMKIDASDANTLDKLNVIAARAIYLMMSRFRVCSFKAIGVPHLQVGDLITVIESSSTISEVYRVTDLATNMDSEGYTMDITCHWYSHG